MKVAITIAVTDGYDTALELSKSTTVVDETLPELDETYPRPPRVKGFGRASVIVREESSELVQEAVDKLIGLHNLDCRRVDRANDRRAQDELLADSSLDSE